MLLYTILAEWVLAARPVMLAALAVNCALLITDIIKRGFLSRLVIWYFTMLAEPAAIIVCVGLTLGSLLAYGGAELREWLPGFLLDILIAAAASVTALIILVRGHINVIDKRLPVFSECSPERLGFVSVRRLVIAGAAGTVISALFFIVLLIFQSPVLTLFYIIFLLGILCPFLIMLSLISLVGAGLEILVLGILFALIIIEYLTVLNGCFRYIFTADFSKAVKAVLAVLCVIFPPFGVIYGFYAIYDLDRRCKMKTENS